MSILIKLWRDYKYWKYGQMKRENPTPTETFTMWFNRQGFKHFTADEFTSYFEVERRGVRNSQPPKEIWANIVPTVKIVDELREKLGKSIVILSSYRSPKYNSRIDGAATKSFHMTFQALDIVAAGYTPQEVFNALKEMRDAGKFKGGLGKYNTFTHIDTRGYNATW
jgi:uncharacterized protein YcbK (DUF882 family)